MPMLTINGVTIRVLPDWTRPIDQVGADARTYLGAARKSLRALKRSWSFTTRPLQRQEATAVEALATGAGECWSFNTDQYSGKARPVTLPTGASISGTHAKYGGSSLQLAGSGSTITVDSPAITIRPGTEHTLMAWLYSALTAGDLHASIDEYDASDTVLASHVLNVANDSAWHFASTTFTAAATVSYIKIHAYIDTGPTGNAYVDDLAWIPAALTAAQLAEIEAAAQAFTPPPAVRLEGDILGSESVSCRGSLQAARGSMYRDDAGWHAGARTVSFTLEEE